MLEQQEKVQIHVRAEVKPNERRSALTPENAARLLATQNFHLFVERSADRIFPDEQYQEAGCELVDAGSWKTAPPNRFILGLKELPEEDHPLGHRHIYFAHCYKNQTGWKELLSRFVQGKGTILDMEFLVNDQGRRIAAFGRAAGLAGCAVGLLVWSQQLLHPGEPLPSLKDYPTVQHLVEVVTDRLAQVKERLGKTPKVMVMGAKGRCGQGAVYFLKEAGLADDATQWDMEETAKGGPFPEILDHHIFVNCIYLQGSIPPFLTKDMLRASADRQLSVVVDVSCDYTNPFNPLPIYSEATSFVKPTLVVDLDRPASALPLEVVSIDHLPSMVPKESSTDFSNDLFPSILELAQYARGAPAPVWDRAEKLYHEKCALLQ